MKAWRMVTGGHVRAWLPLFLAVTWVALAMLKAVALPQVTAIIDAAMLMPPYLAAPAAVLIVAWEFVLGVGLLIPVVRGAALWATSATLFTYLGFSLWRAVGGMQDPCPCSDLLLPSTPGMLAVLCVGLLIPTVYGLVARDGTFGKRKET